MNQLKIGFAGSLVVLSLAHCSAQDPAPPREGTGGSAGASATGGSGGSGGSVSGGSGGTGGASTGGSGGTGGSGTGGSGGSTGGSGGATGGSGGAGGTTGGSAGAAGSGTGGAGGTVGRPDGGIVREAGSDARTPPPPPPPAGDAGTGVGGPSRCTGANYTICEDFEATAEGAVPTGWTKHGNASVAADQAARGTHSLKILAAANGERRIYHDASMLGAAHWGRIFYRTQLPVPTVFVHSTLVGLQGVGPRGGNGEYRVVDTVKDANQKHQFLYNVQPSGAEFGKGSPYNWTFDGNWHCAEWSIDSATQSYHFYYDNAEVTSIAINNGAGNYNGTDIPPVFTQVHVGWNNYQSAPPGFVAWIDEVALNPTRIGCSN